MSSTPKTRKTTSRKKIKKELWDLTSQYVRRKNADHAGYVSCVTCGLTKHWKQMQAGHFIPQAQGDAVKFDLRNIHVQCYRCNMNLGGNGPEYYPFMQKTHGEEVIQELRRLSNTTVKFTNAEIVEMIDEMKKRLSDLE